jgi:sugar/nucleoside kinase (ribokinase family)
MQDILGIGNAICDVIVRIDENILNKFALTKGSMSLCSEEESSKLLAYLTANNYELTVCSGGSVANTINYLSQYNLNTAFLGNVSQGDYGKRFQADLQATNVKFYNSDSNITKTAKSIILVTPDGERTMYTSLGCAANLGLENLNLEQICASKYIYIEGYLWDQPKTIKTIKEIIYYAKEQHNSKIVFSLSDSFCVERHHGIFFELVMNHIDILFANEDEINCLFKLNNFATNKEQIQKTISNSGLELIAVTQNDQGCTLINKDNFYKVATKKVKPLDTTGAGDSFAAGFLYGLLTKMDIVDAAKIANYIAAQIVTYLGARPKVILPKNINEIK